MENIKNFETEELIDFLRKEKDLKLSEEDFEILEKEEIIGSDFFYLTREDLERHGMKFGPAKSLVMFAKECEEKGEKEKRVPVEQFVVGHKRRRMIEDEVENDNYNEHLRKVWKAFKNAKMEDNILNLSKDASFLLGKDNYNKPMSTLFIRNCYLDLSKIIFNVDKSRWFITGNPGIGKTFFGYYLLYLIAQEDGMVIYHQHHRPPILFSKDTVYCHTEDNVHIFKHYLANEDVWYIVDAREPMEYRAKTILISSPQKTSFCSRGIDIRYMPVWSLAEINFCRNNIDIFKHLTTEEVQNLYYKWGGIPRFVLFHAHNYCLQKLLDTAIYKVEKSIMYFVGGFSSGNSDIHELVHIHTNVPEREEAEEGSSTSVSSNPLETYYMECTLEFASDYVSERVINKLAKNYRQELLNFVNTSENINGSGTLRRAMFEQLAHRKLLRGGKFKVRPIERDIESSDPPLELDNMEKVLFSSIDDIEYVDTTKYYIPTQKNHKSFDSLILTNKFFQMTIAESHPINKSGLEKYINGITCPNEEISFYFVLPKTRFNTYREQELHTTKGTVFKGKPAWFDRLKQYALEIDLKINDL